MDIVDDELLVTGASVLWAFNMNQAIDPVTGDKIAIDTQATNSHVILEPSDFKMRFDVRNEPRRKQIMESYWTVADGLKVY